MADNRASTNLYKCVRCGQLYQAVTKAAVDRCRCGGQLYAVRKLEVPEKPK